MSAVIEKPGLLVPGWYAIGFQGEDGQINWGAAPIYHYVGDGEWVDEDEAPINRFYQIAPKCSIHRRPVA